MKIYHKADGKELDRDLADARELLATGAYSEQPTTDEEMEAHAAKLNGTSAEGDDDDVTVRKPAAKPAAKKSNK